MMELHMTAHFLYEVIYHTYQNVCN